MGRRLIIGALAALAFSAAIHVFSAHSDETAIQIYARTAGDELVAELPARADWCQPELTFTIRGQDDELFKGGRVLLQKLLAGIRVGLQKECPQAVAVTFNGYVDDVFVYRGYAARDEQNWALLTIPVVLVEQPPPPLPTPMTVAAVKEPPAPRRESIAECDAAAAHPNDPQRPKSVRGVSDDDLNAGSAIRACEEAIRVEPNTPRLQFQLARAYLLYDKHVDGIDLIIAAAEAGHGPALAALGDFALYGVLDDDPDPETAKALYERAAKAGFKPAAKLAAEIVANPKEDTSQKVAQEPNYHHPQRLATLLKGEPIGGTGDVFSRMFVYGMHAMGGIKHHCPNAGVNVSMQAMMNTISKRAGAGGGMWAPLIGGLSVAHGAYPQLEQQAMDDGYALAFTRGCDSQQVAAVQTTLRATIQ